jgi:hypothetical protein
MLAAVPAIPYANIGPVPGEIAYFAEVRFPAGGSVTPGGALRV